MSPRERAKEEAKAKEVRVIGAKDLAEDRRMEAQQDACNIRRSETRNQSGEVINVNKKILWRKDVTLKKYQNLVRKVQNSINQSIFSGHFPEPRGNCPAHSCENKYREADSVLQEVILEDL